MTATFCEKEVSCFQIPEVKAIVDSLVALIDVQNPSVDTDQVVVILKGNLY